MGHMKSDIGSEGTGGVSVALDCLGGGVNFLSTTSLGSSSTSTSDSSLNSVPSRLTLLRGGLWSDSLDSDLSTNWTSRADEVSERCSLLLFLLLREGRFVPEQLDDVVSSISRIKEEILED